MGIGGGRAGLGRATAVLLALTIAWSSGCQPEHDPPSLINKLRIIGARAEPPFVSFSKSPKVELLVVGHDPKETLCYGWAMCLFASASDGGFRCFDPRLQVPLGTGATATLGASDILKTFAELPAVLEDKGIDLSVFSGPQTDVKDCPTEAPKLPVAEIFVLFKVAERTALGGTCPNDPLAMLQTNCESKKTCLAGYKRLALAIDLEMKDCQPVPVPAPDKEHTNPRLLAPKLRGVPWPEEVTPVVRPFIPTDSVVDLDQAALNFEDGQYQEEIEPVWTPQSKEVVGKSPDPNAPDVEETLIFSWYSDAGEWKKQRSYDEVPQNFFRAPGSGDTGEKTVRIWLVVRDGRNGTDWLQRTLKVRADADVSKSPVCVAAPGLVGCP